MKITGSAVKIHKGYKTKLSISSANKKSISFLNNKQNRNDSSKNNLYRPAKNPARDNRETYLSRIKNQTSFSLMSASPALGEKCRALRGDRGMLAYTGQSIIEKQKALLPSFLSGGSMQMNRIEQNSRVMRVSEESGIE